MATQSEKTKQKEKKSKETETEDLSTVEKLEEPNETPPVSYDWKSYQLFFTEGKNSGKRFGYLIASDGVSMDNLNGVMLSGCDIKAMDMRAPADIINTKNVDPVK